MESFEKIQKAIEDGFMSGLTGKPLPAHYLNKHQDKITSVTNTDVVGDKTIEISFDSENKVFTATVDGWTKKARRRRDLIRGLKKKGFTKFMYDPGLPSGD